MDLLDLVEATREQVPPSSERFVAFADWSAEDLGRLRGVGRLESYEPGHEVVSASADDRDLFVVASGELEVTAGKDGLGQRIARLGPSDVFGEVAFIDGRPRSASVRAVTASRAVRISLDDLDELAAREPQLALRFLREIARILSDRLRTATTG
jgi:CRP/FNR family cyclic AMP-dependent transcriptional regulator